MFWGGGWASAGWWQDGWDLEQCQERHERQQMKKYRWMRIMVNCRVLWIRCLPVLATVAIWPMHHMYTYFLGVILELQRNFRFRWIMEEGLRSVHTVICLQVHTHKKGVFRICIFWLQISCVPFLVFLTLTSLTLWWFHWICSSEPCHRSLPLVYARQFFLEMKFLFLEIGSFSGNRKRYTGPVLAQKCYVSFRLEHMLLQISHTQYSVLHGPMKQ